MTASSFVTVTDMVLGIRPVSGLLARVMERIDLHGPEPPDPALPVEGGCWLWLGGCIPSGYGSISVNDETQMVHRLVYELLIGPIPEGYEIDHRCRVRVCCRPGHTEPVTPEENMRRSRRPVCRKGHSMTEGNTGPVKGKRWQRVCRTCAREKARQYRARRKANG